MPNETFLSAYGNLRLSEVVLPGAHDAGVYTDGLKENVQTQKLDIMGQALSGCRFFDLRIATVKHKDGRLEQKAFHLDPSLVRNHSVLRTTSHQNVGHLGGWGDALDTMLDQAKAFVTGVGAQSEFLILKFSKCYNWENVAQACLTRLGDAQYKEPGIVNLNSKKCSELAGKVITVFDEEARKTLDPWKGKTLADTAGIKYISGLYDKKTGRSKGYKDSYDGIQYFGKFSSTDDIVKNQQKQEGLLVKGAGTNPKALGMMYWTTTAMKQNIRTRNKSMWTGAQTQKLQETWYNGLEAAIRNGMGDNKSDIVDDLLQQGVGSMGGAIKPFMPNIVMMDFVSPRKCSTIIELNDITPFVLQEVMSKGIQNDPAPKKKWWRRGG